MRRTITKVAAGLCCLITFGQYADDLQAQPTNVIVIVADDAGYADWGFMDGVSGSNPTPTPIPTPNLDALANRGVKFSRAYVAQSCQPTRAALVTGGYQNRIGNEVVGDNVQGLPASATTIWDRMKDQNYTTGAVGKWHLGSVAGPQGNRPETQGVDKFYGIWHGSRTFTLGNTGLQQSQLLREVITQPNGSFTDTVVESNFTNNANLASDDFTHEMGRYAVDFIDEHHDDANPFFLYQSFTAPHTPLKDDPVYFNDPRITGLTGLQRQYASMMLAMDDQIGQIVAKLEDPAGDGTGPGSDSDNISDNTLIMFVNDNGGAEAPGSAANGSDNGILRARKGSSFEGGIRVPMIIAGAGVDPGVHGTTYDRPVHGVDILPTAVAAGGGNVGVGDAGIDGVNLLPFINGTNSADPHNTIVNRHRTQFAVIKGDMKLVWTGGSPASNPAQAHQLYNVATDPGETNDISGANPALVAELHRDLTRHEATFDKQRYEILGQSDERFQTFDHFTFNPANPGGGTTNVIQGATGNGDFEASEPATGPIPFDQTPNWHHANNTGANEGINFTNDSQTGGSSQSNSRAGMPFQNRFQINDTGYTITSAGEVFDISYEFGAGGALGNWTGDEVMRTFLFTSSTTVDGDTVVGDLTELGEDIYAIDRANDPQWTTRTANGVYTTTAADIGKTIYFGMEFQDPSGPLLFPRIDLIDLQVTSSGSGGASVADWSDSGIWNEGGTSNSATMYHADSFPGAVLEFPTTDSFSYTSNNDMTRSTGLEFMLNKMVFSGTFAGTQNQTATVQGNAVLFTNDLNGVGPQLEVTASNSGVPSFEYNLDLEVILYDNLTITGDGDATLRINGEISNYSEPRGLTKSGTSTAILTANNTYEGDTIVEEGTLSITNAFLEDSADVYLETGGIFDLDFSGTDTIDSLFIDGISQAIGTWGAIGSGANNESALITGSGLLLVSTLDALAGDFDLDGDVDGADFLTWQRDGGSLTDWQNNYGSQSSPAQANSGAVPEPTSLALLGLALSFLAYRGSNSAFR
ncbi:MAG: sulfatase-like hydrolase/transferase [Lacipirellulaceae bacterium]